MARRVDLGQRADQDGDPIAGVQVWLFAVSYGRRKPQLEPRSRAATDSRARYRTCPMNRGGSQTAAGATVTMTHVEHLYHPELAILPIGDLFTMGPREAALACTLLQPKKVIPMHFGTFPALTGRPDQLGIDVWTLEPGRPAIW